MLSLLKRELASWGLVGTVFSAEGIEGKVFVLRGSMVTRKYKVDGSKVASAAEGQEP